MRSKRDLYVGLALLLASPTILVWTMANTNLPSWLRVAAGGGLVLILVLAISLGSFKASDSQKPAFIEWINSFRRRRIDLGKHRGRRDG